MKVETAQLPGPEESDDRIFVTSNAVIMLDGASSYLPTCAPVGAYVDQLGGHIAYVLTDNPDVDLVTAIAEGIKHAARALRLEPGRSPSSTVAITRVRSDREVDALVLGDTQIAWPGGMLRDERIANVGVELRDAYRERLMAGFGYDEEHQTLLRQLQMEQTRHRNRPGGYWISETEPAAARHALTARLPASDSTWVVLSTDGAYRPLRHLGLDHWADVSQRTSGALHGLLARCQCWEARSDPNGAQLPRAKPQDDKAIATLAR